MRARTHALPAERAVRAWRGLRSAALSEARLSGKCAYVRAHQTARRCRAALSCIDRPSPTVGQAGRKAGRRCLDGSVAGRQMVLAAERCASYRPELAAPMRARTCAPAHARTHMRARTCAHGRLSGHGPKRESAEEGTDPSGNACADTRCACRPLGPVACERHRLNDRRRGAPPFRTSGASAWNARARHPWCVCACAPPCRARGPMFAPGACPQCAPLGR
jgi:hypothetical protein